MNAVANQAVPNTDGELVLPGTREMPRRLTVTLSRGFVDAAVQIRFRLDGKVKYRTVAYTGGRRPEQCSILTCDGRKVLLIGDDGRFPITEQEASQILARIPLREWS